MAFLIFGFSAQDADESSSLSEEITEDIVRGVNDVFHQGWSEPQILYYMDTAEFYVRKAAHFTEYFVFGALLTLPLFLYGVPSRRIVPYAGCIAFLYSVTDELHQFASPGRTPQVRDVVIDTAGALIGILVVRAIYRAGKKKTFRGLVRLRERSGGFQKNSAS